MFHQKATQYFLFRQWSALKEYCEKKQIRIMGDVPIYVNLDSADVWSNPEIFRLTAEKNPEFVAGVPPDYFSRSGQLWGNPVYDWEVLKATGYRWWVERLKHALGLVDLIRIDHFRGLVAFWQVPAGNKTALKGKWIDAPVTDFLDTLLRHFTNLPLVAEDLGMITADVREIVKSYDLPGMKVLQFAFSEDKPMHPYLPHTLERNSVIYTGTHDNNTARGWFEKDALPADKRRFFSYLGREVTADEVSWELLRLAQMSVANLAICPMQDILGLGAEARMNTPSTANGNWQWRLLPGQSTPELAERLAELTRTYGRA
jgi:4-alpha-glucanotransferase